jgi:hypothetical protein
MLGALMVFLIWVAATLVRNGRPYGRRAGYPPATSRRRNTSAAAMIAGTP